MLHFCACEIFTEFFSAIYSYIIFVNRKDIQRVHIFYFFLQKNQQRKYFGLLARIRFFLTILGIYLLSIYNMRYGLHVVLPVKECRFESVLPIFT